jgi:hypothetical protein
VLVAPGTGQALVERVGRLGEAGAGLIRGWVDRYLDDRGGRPGRRLPFEVVRWLFPQPPAPPSVADFALSSGAPVAATLVELAAQVTGVVPDPSAFRPLATWAALGGGMRGIASGADVDLLGQGPAFPASVLQSFVTEFGPHTVAPLLLPSLLTEPDDPALSTLVARLRDGVLRPWSADERIAAVSTAVELRHQAGTWYASSPQGGQARGLLDAVTAVLSWTPAPRVAPDVVLSVIAAYVVEVINGADERPELHDWLGTAIGPDGIVPGQVTELLTTAMRNEIVRITDVAVAALACTPRTAAVARLKVGPSGRSEPLLDRVVRPVLRELVPRDARRFIDEVQRIAAQIAGQAAFPPERWWRRVLNPETAEALFGGTRFSW